VWLLAISARSARQRKAIDLFVRRLQAGRRLPDCPAKWPLFDRLVRRHHDVRVAGISDPGYAFHNSFN
jgi:hypothetical protein